MSDIASGRLRGKVVIVTGAAHGIGRAMASCIAREGASVFLTDIDATGNEVADQLRVDGADAEFAQVDSRDADGFAELARQIQTNHARIDGLVNNAGVNVKYEPLDMPDEEWDRCLDINLRGAWNGAKSVLPIMKSQGGGSIVNIASIHGHRIVPHSFPYPVSKHGLIGLTKALGVEYAPMGIRVNAISPGYIHTRLLEEYWNSQPDPAKAQAQSAATVPAGRIGRPEEVGMTAVFLLSDEAPYINASVIVIDGGGAAQYHP